MDLTVTGVTDASPPILYTFECVTGGCTEDDLTPGDNLHSATGLTASTSYEWDVRAIDDEGNSTTVASISQSTNAPPSGATATFVSNWDNACTGTADSCIGDNGLWTDTASYANSSGLMVVRQGGIGVVPAAWTGSYVLEINTNDSRGAQIVEDAMLDLTAQNHYWRWMKHINCDYENGTGTISYPIGGPEEVPAASEGPGKINHGFQDNPQGGVSGSWIWYATDISSVDCDGVDGDCSLAMSIHSEGTDSNAGRPTPGSPDYVGMAQYGTNNDAATAHYTECGEWVMQEIWLECPDNDACLNVTEHDEVTVKFHAKETVMTGPNIGTVYDDDDFWLTHYNGTSDQTPGISYSEMNDTLDGGWNWRGGYDDFSLGISGQTHSCGQMEGDISYHTLCVQVLYWLDAFAYGSSNLDDDWIGAP